MRRQHSAASAVVGACVQVCLATSIAVAADACRDEPVYFHCNKQFFKKLFIRIGLVEKVLVDSLSCRRLAYKTALLFAF